MDRRRNNKRRYALKSRGRANRVISRYRKTGRFTYRGRRNTYGNYRRYRYHVRARRKNMYEGQITPPELVQAKTVSNQKRKRTGFMIAAISTLFLSVGVSLLMIFPGSVINWFVTLEAGSPRPTVSRFIKKKNATGKFVTDMNAIDMTQPGFYRVGLTVDGKQYYSLMRIKDSIAPRASVKNLTVWQRDTVPAASFVESIQDATSVTVSFRHQPDFNKPGMQYVDIELRDLGNNRTRLKAALTVKQDTEAPVILGPIDQIVFVGDRVSYRKGVYVTDNRDQDLGFNVDSSRVNLASAGTYPVMYTAKDSSGNETNVKVTLKVEKKPKDYVSPEVLDKLADRVLKRIIRNKMTPVQKAKAIYTWTKHSIAFSARDTSTDLKRGAYLGLKGRRGDCYIYYSASRYLLSRAGIDNIEIQKYDGGHYWNMVNLGKGWYHFDATPRYGGGEFFMLTDAQLEKYSKKHKNSHKFLKTRYPGTPVK